MSLKIYDDSKNYTAQVIKLPVKQAVQGLDNLVEVNVFGNSCLIGKDSPEDQLYLFFPAGCAINEDFLVGNNLYRDSQLNSDPTKKGFFEPNGRVKAIKFRGIISTGFVIPVNSLKYIYTDGTDRDWACGSIAQLKEGDQFNEWEGNKVCYKYFVPSQTQSQGKGDKVTKINNKLVDLMVPNQFRFHVETSHLGNNLHRFEQNDIVVITDKWHGSSCILSKVLINRKLSLWQRILNWLGAETPDKEYGYIYSSGKPKSNLPKGIEGSWTNDGVDYYSSNIWKQAFDDYKDALEDGISLYGELVGYTKGGSYIQKGYDYGCVAPLHNDGIPEIWVDPNNPYYKFVIYRITYTKPNGEVIEFSWQQIKDYCTKYNLEYAKEFYHGSIKELLKELYPEFPDNSTPPLEKYTETLFQALQTAYNLEKTCSYCRSGVPAEGIVVRIDGKQQFNAFKLKSKLFLKKESDDLDKGETNIEDQQ